MRGHALVLLTFAAVAPTRRADACSAAPCRGGYAIPGASGAVAPASLPAIYLIPEQPFSSAGTATAALTLARTDTGEQLAFDLEQGSDFFESWLVRPRAPLVDGVEYALTTGPGCVGFERQRRFGFRASAAAPLPATLGALRLTRSERTSIRVASSGPCSTMVDAAIARVEIAFDPAAEPWRDVFVYQTHVDGQPYNPSASLPFGTPPGESWVGRGVDMLAALCGSDFFESALSEGAHTVEIEARVPGTAIALRTPPLTVELRCGAAPDAGVTPDGALGADDGGTRADAGATVDASLPTSEPSGCASAAASEGALTLALLALALGHARRRARSSQAAPRV